MNRAKEEEVCFSEDTAFDCDMTVFDNDPMENALSWLQQQVSILPDLEVSSTAGLKCQANMAEDNEDEEMAEDEVGNKVGEAEGVGVLGSDGKRRRGGRGAGSRKRHKRAGNPTRKLERLAENLQKKGDMFESSMFSITEDGSVTSTGWHGSMPTSNDRRLIDKAYTSGEIHAMVAKFHPIRYNESLEKPTFLADCEGRIFACRSSMLPWLSSSCSEVAAAVDALLHLSLSNEPLRDVHADNSRGPHFPCIIGHYRPYSKRPVITGFHTENMERVKEFIATPIIQRIIRFAEHFVKLFFPGVADRFKRCVDWHQQKYPDIQPLFGCFWNLCINGMFLGQHRIHCGPHADVKNIVGVCLLMVYVLPGSNFDHHKKTWLVLWEAGVAVELPPWVFFAYPSSLLYHFNIDVDDIEFVCAPAGVQPTRDSYTPLQEGGDKGRGSFVFFNQATMYQSSETGYGTLGAAKKAGHSGNTSFTEDAQAAFSRASRFPLY